MTTKLTLSPEAEKQLRALLPLEATGSAIYPAESIAEIATVFIRGSHHRVESEIAAVIAALVNAALAPADAAPGEPGQGSAGVEQASAGRAGDQVKA